MYSYYKFESLGKKLLNPFNIRYNPKNHWQGQLTPYLGFCSFESSYYGFRAGIKLLTGRAYRGKSIHDIISRYAPSCENDTARYIKYVCEQLEVTSDFVMPPLTSNTWKWFLLCRSISYYETGYVFYYEDFLELLGLKHSDASLAERE